MRVIVCLISLLIPIFSFSEVVITVHGFLRGEANFKKLGRYFEKRGDTVHHFIYPSKRATIKEHAVALNRFVQKIKEEHPQENIAFVTHSLGGIILRQMYQLEVDPSLYKIRLVLIAPPNQGSVFARKLSRFPGSSMLFGDKAGKELYINDDFQHLGDFPIEARVLIIAGTFGFNPFIPARNDGKVATGETLLLTKHDYVEIRRSHSIICNAKKTIELAYEYIHTSR